MSQNSFEQFKKIEESLQHIQDSILETLKWTDIDQRNIMTSTEDVSAQIKTAQDYFETKRLQKRAQIEEKYAELERQRKAENQHQAELRNSQLQEEDPRLTADRFSDNLERKLANASQIRLMQNQVINEEQSTNALRNIEEITQDLKEIEEGKTLHKDESNISMDPSSAKRSRAEDLGEQDEVLHEQDLLKNEEKDHPNTPTEDPNRQSQ